MTRAIKTLLGLSLLITLDSCGPQGTVVRADDYDAETIVDLMNEEEPIVSGNAAKPHKPVQHKSQKHSGAPTAVGGEWSIVEAGGKAVDMDAEEPYIIFSDKEGRFYASNGCNYLNGDYSYSADNMLSFSNVITTMRLCADEVQERNINRVLNSTTPLRTRIENKDRETYLYITSTTSNEVLMKLRKHNLEVINGEWNVAYIGEEDVQVSGINLFFDIPERLVHGNTGCNYFNGKINIDPTVESSISFSQMGVTMRMCENAEIERQLLVGLEETESYIIDGNTLFLNNAKGQNLIVLKRAF